MKANPSRLDQGLFRRKACFGRSERSARDCTPKKFKKGGVAATGTFNPSQADQILTLPQYRDHIDDIFDSRQVNDSRQLMQQLFRFDPDVSATVNSYLTLANTEPMIVAKTLDDQIDREATQSAWNVIQRITRT